MPKQPTTAGDLIERLNRDSNQAWPYYDALPCAKLDNGILLRIADALERMSLPVVLPPKKIHCHFCRQDSEFGERIGYGTSYDGKYICADCLQAALDIFTGGGC